MLHAIAARVIVQTVCWSNPNMTASVTEKTTEPSPGPAAAGPQPAAQAAATPDLKGRGPVLIVAAHPDDPEFGCAATQAKFVADGRQVVIGLVTSGNEGGEDPSVPDETLMAMREEEQLNASRVLGVQTVEFLRYRDGRVVNDLKLRRDIVRLIRRHKPETIFTHDPTNFFGEFGINHPDHRAVGHATLDAIFPGAGNPRSFRELLAEGLQPHKVSEVCLFFTSQANFWIDVTNFVDKKIESLREHKSQVKKPDEMAPRIREWATKAGEVHGVGAAEGFRRIQFRR